MSRAAFASFARNMGRAQFVRQAAMKGLRPQFAKVNTGMQGMNFAFPEMMLKNQRVTQLAKMAARSRRLCALQLQKIQIGALSVLLTSTGEILIDFQELINSIEETDEDELLRRTSLLVQTLV